MSSSLFRAVVVAGMAIVAALLSTASPVAAECLSIDPWPSFQEAARSAKRIVVGEVVEAYLYDSAGNAIQFRFRVDEVLRGRSDPEIEFRDFVKSGAPLTICPGDSILRVRVGDVIAFAFDAQVAGSPDPLLTVAYVRGAPDEFLMPGVERITLAEARSLAAAPSTDTAIPTDRTVAPVPVGPLLAVSLLGALAVLVRTRRHDA